MTTPLSRPESAPDLSTAEARLLARLRAGDEQAFRELVERLGPSMLRVAQLYVRDRTVAQEIVQEAWLRALRGLDGFEARSSLRTWIFVILANCARRRAQHEQRTIPFADPHEPSLDAAVDPEQFFLPSHPRWAGAWSTIVDDWTSLPLERLLSEEAQATFRAAVAELPARYEMVITLRDLEDWSSEEVCALLGISPENQRVLLQSRAGPGSDAAGPLLPTGVGMIRSDPLSCQEVVELVTQYLEETMSAGRRLGFEEHIAICPPCRNYFAQFRHTIALGKTIQKDDLPAWVQAALIDGFRDWRAGRTEPGPGES